MSKAGVGKPVSVQKDHYSSVMWLSNGKSAQTTSQSKTSCIFTNTPTPTFLKKERHFNSHSFFFLGFSAAVRSYLNPCALGHWEAPLAPVWKPVLPGWLFSPSIQHSVLVWPWSMRVFWHFSFASLKHQQRKQATCGFSPHQPQS